MEKNKNSLLYKVIHNYYEKGLTQQKIAVKYGISRIKVSRIISKALDDKIVQIKINIHGDSSSELEQRLEEIYDLHEAVVVDVTSANIIEELGKAVANYLSLRIRGHETIGVTWGKSILAVVKAMPELNYPDVRIVQMLGGLGNTDSDIHGTELAVRMANIYKAKVRLLNSPGIVKSKEICTALIDNLQVSDTLKLAENATIALVGIGALTRNSLITQESKIITEEEFSRLIQKGAVGDVGLRFFDEFGNQIADEIEERVVGLTHEQIQKIPRTIGVAGGNEKQTAILAALRGKWINTLITDNKTAQFLVNVNNN